MKIMNMGIIHMIVNKKFMIFQFLSYNMIKIYNFLIKD